MKTRYDVLFLEFGVPLETRYGGSGQLTHLVHYLNKFGIKSALVVVRDPLTSKRVSVKMRSSIFRFLSLHSIILNLIRKIFLSYSKEDYIDFDIVKIKNLVEIKKLNPHFISSWSWESAYLINKMTLNNNIRKLQILHYKWEPSFLIDYIPAEYHPIFRDTYYSNMTKIAISKTQLDDFKDAKIYHWLQGIDTEKFFYKKNKIKDQLQILIPLRNPREKGAIYAIQVAEIIHGFNKKLKIISYGNYSGNIPKFIIHKGRINFLNLIRLYRESDIFILPSLEEGFSFPGLEAMASGCVVISTKNGGSDQYITDGFNGLLVERGDVKAMANAVLKLVDDPVTLRSLITNAQKVVWEYTYEKSAQRFINILKEICCVEQILK